MKLNEQGLRDRAVWEAKGYRLPAFDRPAAAATAREPVWVHFGNGNLFKAFQAHAVQKLLDAGDMTVGVITADRRRKGEDHNDGYCILATLKSDGSVDKTVIGSITQSLYLSEDMDRLGEIFRSPSLQMCSFTITEKGYSLTDGQGQLLPDAAADGVEEPFSFVNAEETEYLVVEDSFPNGRPPLEKAGVIFTDRETVDKVRR